MEQIRRMMAAEEASLRGGWFEHIINFYERWLRRAFAASGRGWADYARF